MQVTADLQDLCRLVCPHCAKSVDLRYRADSAEYVHDVSNRNTFIHTICWANGLRKKYQGKIDG
jgi:hypothetical protein